MFRHSVSPHPWSLTNWLVHTCMVSMLNLVTCPGTEYTLSTRDQTSGHRSSPAARTRNQF